MMRNSASNTRRVRIRNDYWAEEMVEIADDGSNDWMDTKWAEVQQGSGASADSVAVMEAIC